VYTVTKGRLIKVFIKKKKKNEIQERRK